MRFLSLAVCTCGLAWSQPAADPLSATQEPDSANAAEPTAGPAAAPKVEGQDMRDRVFYAEETERAKPLMRKFVVNVLMDQRIFGPVHST